ncbi:hypothetical protein, partial [Methylobacterium iners]
MRRLMIAAGALLALTTACFAEDRPFAHGMTLRPGDTVSTPQPLRSLRANASDRFTLPDGTTARLSYPNGRPVTSLRLVGQQGGRAFYAAVNDRTAAATQAPPPPPEPMLAAAAGPAVVNNKAGNGCVANFRSAVRDRVV